MREWDDQIIILRLGLFHEADIWLRVLSRDKGLLTLFAFGGAKSRRRFCGCLDKFNTIQCRIKGGRSGYLSLAEASLVEAPRNLRSDWRRMGIAANCILFMEALHIDSDSSNAAFILMENLRNNLENGRQSCRLTPFFFRLHLSSLLGFAPDLESCGICGKSNGKSYFFVPEEGRIFCPECLRSLESGKVRHGINVSRHVLTHLSHVRFSLPSEWMEDDLLENDKRLCSRLIDYFIRYHLGLAWENGRFRTI